MTEIVRKPKWSSAEREALEHAFQTLRTADELLSYLRSKVPTAPKRTFKAYTAQLYRDHPSQEERLKPIFLDLKRAVREEDEALSKLGQIALSTAEGKSWLDELDPTPAPPSVSPRPAPAPNFVKPAAPVKPDPTARVPRHLPVPPASLSAFSLADAASFLGVSPEKVVEAIRDRGLYSRDGASLTRPVFDVLHAALCEGWTFDEACSVAREKFPPPTPLVPAEQLYDSPKAASTVDEVPVLKEEFLPPPPAEIHVPEVAVAEQRQWALEALAEGVFTVEQAFKIAGVTDTPRNRWALELLGRGEITLVQAAKLLR